MFKSVQTPKRNSVGLGDRIYNFFEGYKPLQTKEELIQKLLVFKQKRNEKEIYLSGYLPAVNQGDRDMQILVCKMLLEIYIEEAEEREPGTKTPFGSYTRDDKITAARSFLSYVEKGGVLSEKCKKVLSDGNLKDIIYLFPKEYNSFLEENSVLQRISQLFISSNSNSEKERQSYDSTSDADSDSVNPVNFRSQL